MIILAYFNKVEPFDNGTRDMHRYIPDSTHSGINMEIAWWKYHGSKWIPYGYSMESTG
jgi:hypothetical protein